MWQKCLKKTKNHNLIATWTHPFMTSYSQTSGTVHPAISTLAKKNTYIRWTHNGNIISYRMESLQAFRVFNVT